jgi:flagellar L-ring protein precursor FlgH
MGRKNKMNKQTILGISIILVSLLVNSSLFAQSLWEKRDRSKAFLFEDLKARQVGDLLTVIISENTGIKNQDSRNLKKSSSSDSSADLDYGLGGDLGNNAANANFGQSNSSDRAFDGDARAATSRVFSDRFTVKVVDVLPNGNMLVSGSRVINVQGDNKRIVLTGIVRMHDIFGDNTINSRQVADLQVTYEGGGGVDKAFTEQGWLGKKLNKIWPY